MGPVQKDLSLGFSITLTANASADAALKHIDLMLNKHERSTNQFGLPHVFHDNTEYERLIASFNKSEQADLSRQMTANLTEEQRSIFKTVTPRMP
ncbi:unnamed protein product [Sphacelaria rigidula]